MNFIHPTERWGVTRTPRKIEDYSIPLQNISLIVTISSDERFREENSLHCLIGRKPETHSTTTPMFPNNLSTCC
ncbi:MAG: hypothetical protein ACK53Y_27800 [bacterium]